MITQRSRMGLLATTALGSALTASLAFAQAPATENSQASANQLEEVVVTATRQAELGALAARRRV